MFFLLNLQEKTFSSSFCPDVRGNLFLGCMKRNVFVEGHIHVSLLVLFCGITSNEHWNYLQTSNGHVTWKIFFFL